MRHAQRAVSIDNISFISSAADDRHLNSTLSKDNNFSTLNNNNNSNYTHMNHNTNNYHHINHKNTNNDEAATSTNIRNGNCSNNHNNNNNHSNHHNQNTTTPVNASIDSLHKASDDEPENIIPWRAQLRKTNSRLSLIG